MTERWETPEEIAAAEARFVAAIPGWRLPMAHGVGRVTGDGVEFAIVNVAVHNLPAVVLATAVGHRGGSASYRLDAAAFARAVELLAPAGACTAFEHPNLWAWQALHASLAPGDEVVAAFAADLDAPPGNTGDPVMQALVAAARQKSAAD